MKIKSRKKRIVTCVLALSLVFSGALGFSFSVSGFTAEPGFSAYAESSLRLDDYPGETWASSAYVRAADKDALSDGFHQFLTTAENVTYRVTKAFDMPADLSAFNELSAVLRIDGGDGECSVVVRLFSGTASVDTSAELPAQSMKKVYFGLEQSEILSSVDRIDVLIRAENVKIASFMIGEMTADNSYTYLYAERFSASALFAVRGTVGRQNDGVILHPESGASEITANYILPDTPYKSGILRIVVSGAASGTASLSVCEKPYTGVTSADAEYVRISSVQLSPGENSYAFYFDFPTGVASYMLTFADLTVSDTDRVKLHSAVFIDCLISDSAVAEDIGAISSCKYDSSDGAVVISGSVTSAAAVKHSGSSLCVYEIPMWASPSDALAGESIAALRLSTKFDFRIESSKLKTPPEACRYAVVLVSEEEKLLIAPPQYPSYSQGTSAITVRRTASAGLYGISSADALTANVKNQIFDIYIDELITDDASAGQLFTWSSKSFYLSNSAVKELDARVNFTAALGCGIYFRLMHGSKEGGVLSPMPDMSDENDAAKLGALSAFLSGRYTAADGFIIYTHADCPAYNAPGASAAQLAVQFATTARLVYNCSSKSIPEINVYIPFSDGWLYNSALAEYYGLQSGRLTPGTGAEQAHYYDPAVMSALVSLYISRDGAMPWQFIYEFESDADAACLAVSRLSEQIKSSSQTTFSGTMLFRQASYDMGSELAGEFSALLKSAERADIACSFLSLVNQSAGSDFYSNYKNIEGFEPAIYSNAENHRQDYTGTIELWNYENAYDALGWIPDERTRVFTAFSDRDVTTIADRTLHITSENAPSVLICPLTDVDLSAAPFLELTLYSASEEDMTVIVGLEGSRCEYTSKLRAGLQTVMCNLSAFEGVDSLRYIAVITSSAARLEISGITANSLTHTDEQLLGLIRAAETKPEQKRISANVYIAAATAGVLSLVAFALLTRRRDNENEKEERK